MKPAELQYARDCLNQIFDRKVKEIKAKSVSGKHISPKDFVSGIKSGKIKLHKDCTVVNVTESTSLFTTTGYNGLFDVKSAGTRDKRDEKDFEAKKQVLCEEFDKIERQLILGDSAKALALIEAYEKTA